MEPWEFKFKQFSVKHRESSMKVGVDAVLIGSWAGTRASNILDVGTGCGVIALMLAQRFPQAQITGIDIDSGSIKEASVNFKNSPWSERISSLNLNFIELTESFERNFDLIVSNPPYFKSGISDPETRREIARHQKDLSVFTLLENSSKLLNKDGVLSIIYPFEFHDKVIEKAQEHDFYLARECKIRGNSRRPVKRVMAEFLLGKAPRQPESELLTLYQEDGFTKEYKKLCKDFYLKF